MRRFDKEMKERPHDYYPIYQLNIPRDPSKWKQIEYALHHSKRYCTLRQLEYDEGRCVCDEEQQDYLGVTSYTYYFR